MSQEKILRVSLDLPTEDVSILDRICASCGFTTRKSALQCALRFLNALVQAKESGLIIRALDQTGSPKLDFNLSSLPKVEPRPEERCLIASIKDDHVKRLKEVAEQFSDPDFGRVSLRLALAAWHPDGPKPVPITLLHELVYFALTLPSPDVLPVVRDILTNMCSTFGSFQELLDAKGDYAPAFDSRLLEQRFLADQYHKSLRSLANERKETS